VVTTLSKADGIAAMRLHALRQHHNGKLSLTDVKEDVPSDEGPNIAEAGDLAPIFAPPPAVGRTLWIPSKMLFRS
jgi:hypothetical protein